MVINLTLSSFSSEYFNFKIVSLWSLIFSIKKLVPVSEHCYYEQVKTIEYYSSLINPLPMIVHCVILMLVSHRSVAKYE